MAKSASISTLILILFLIVIIFTFLGCQDESNNQIISTPTGPTNPVDPPVDPPIDPPVKKIILSGIALSNGEKIPYFEVYIIGPNHLFSAAAESNGYFNKEIFADSTYKIIPFSKYHKVDSIEIVASADTAVQFELKKLNFYPTNIGSTWKYKYKENSAFEIGRNADLEISRKITSKSNNTLTTELHIQGTVANYFGSGYSGRTIDTLLVCHEKKSNYLMHETFMNSLPFALNGKFHFNSIGIYLHISGYDSQTNPNNMKKLSYVDSSLIGADYDDSYPPYYNSEKKFRARNNVGITHLSVNYSDDLAQSANIKLELIDYIPAIQN